MLKLFILWVKEYGQVDLFRQFLLFESLVKYLLDLIDSVFLLRIELWVKVLPVVLNLRILVLLLNEVFFDCGAHDFLKDNVFIIIIFIIRNRKYDVQ